MKFFVTTVRGWKPLAVVTKKSILVSKCVLDLPLLEIEMSKLNKIILLNKYFAATWVPKKWVHQKSMDSCFKLKGKHFCGKWAHYCQINSPQSTVLMLLCYFAQLKHRGCKAWWEHWLGLIQCLSYCNLDRGKSRPNAASRMKFFFVTTVRGWEPLAVVTKKPILVFKGVLDPPLLEIKMSKLNKNQISRREF